MMRRTRGFAIITVLACGGEQGQRAEAAPSAAPSPSASTAVPTSLSAAEAATLRRMREEEKLAHDVYAVLASKGVAFARIQQAERRHFEVIGWQLERYGIPDPSAGKGAGELEDPALQTSYSELVAR